MRTLPHPDDIAAREALAKRPQPSLEKVLEQAEAAREWHKAKAWAADIDRGVSPWIPADKELPGNMRCVLATDMECHFIAIYENDKWICATTSEEIDSHVTHWIELPEVPNE